MDKDKADGKKGSLTDEELNDIYGWVDIFQLSRSKKNIARDFSDGLLVAEIIKSYYPKLVELHNYPASHNVKQKTTNWGTLNRKVFNRMNFQVLKTDIDEVVNCKQYAVEKLLVILQIKIEKYKELYREDTTVNVDQLTGYDGTTHDGTKMGGISDNNIRQSYNNYSGMNENYQAQAQNNLQLMYGNQQMGGVQDGNYMQGHQQMPQNVNQPSDSGQKSKRPNKGEMGPNSVNSSNLQRNQRQSPVIQRAGMNNLRGMGGGDPMNDISGDNRGNMMGQGYPPQGGQYMGGKSQGGRAQNGHYPASDLGFTQTASARTVNNYKGKSSKEMEGLLIERDNVVLDLKDTVEILELKIKKMEQLLALKDGKINNLLGKMGNR